MNPVYVAAVIGPEPGYNYDWSSVSRHVPPWVGLLVAIVLVSLVISIPVWRWRARQGMPKTKKRPEFEGPELTGTAQVLGWIPAVGPGFTNYLTYAVYELPLRVEVPGRQPYEVLVTQRVPTGTAYRAAFRPKMTVGVRVDSADPQNVWIDFKRRPTHR